MIWKEKNKSNSLVEGTSDRQLRTHLMGSQIQDGEGNGTHSSTLAWKIPWTEEPGGLPSMGSHSRTRLK